MNSKIELVSSNDFDTIDIDHFTLNSFNRWPGVNDKMVNSLLKHTLKNYEGLVWIETSGNKINALLAARKLKWDSNFYKFGCYKIDYLLTSSEANENDLYFAVKHLINSYLEFAQTKSVKFTYCSIDTSNRVINNALVAYNFRYLLTWIDGFIKSKESQNSLTIADVSFGLINEQEIDFFKEIAKNNYFSEGRFYLDPKFDKIKVNQMYSELITNSYENKDILLVYRICGKPAGLFICNKIATYSHFDNLKVAPLRFLVLDPEQRGKGFSYDFFCRTIDYLKNYSDIITTGLEVHNLPSLNLHSKLNFTFNYTHNLYHYWH